MTDASLVRQRRYACARSVVPRSDLARIKCFEQHPTSSCYPIVLSAPLGLVDVPLIVQYCLKY